MYKFLFFRVQHKAYWYPAALLSRNFIFAFIPVLQKLLIQIMVLCVLVLPLTLVTTRCLPWRVEAANWMDIGMNVVLLLLLLAATAMGDFEASAVLLGDIATGILVFMFLILFVSVGHIF